ncbi:heat shock factor 2-binding protein isoform X4 [Nothoprocta perdicaria]|uniref:heat shock factor 2-binding protein isoform X4 n=1 Tax=Nothoprocta perdicaria TaxID=30464 RepID=UPI000E1C093C|nr:heat shock factor 2-binding protein isoform X4 [Nothoprocta perdicaria]
MWWVGPQFVRLPQVLNACVNTKPSCFRKTDQKAETEDDFVKVKRRDLERLTTEVMQLRDFLPKILAGDILGTFQKLDALESNMEKKEEEVEQLKMDCEHFRARLEIAQADCMREKKEKLDLRQHLNEAKQQLLQQAEYCTEMGAAVCTLLWGVSSSEEAVKNILGASKAVKFFTITAQTMESFVKSLNEDMKQQDLDSDENQFVLALAGIVTNVAALACGREFLVTSNRELLDTMMQLLGDMKPGLCTKFKVPGYGSLSSRAATSAVGDSGARGFSQVGPRDAGHAALPAYHCALQEPQRRLASTGQRTT